MWFSFLTAITTKALPFVFFVSWWLVFSTLHRHPELIRDRNALVGFVGCIKIPACAGKTTVLSNIDYSM
jgi:hypothetical protein